MQLCMERDYSARYGAIKDDGTQCGADWSPPDTVGLIELRVQRETALLRNARRPSKH